MSDTPSTPRDKMIGVEVSEEETARGLGFVNVEAFRMWRLQKERLLISEQTGWLLAEVCNLREQVKSLERRLADTGTERIG